MPKDGNYKSSLMTQIFHSTDNFTKLCYRELNWNSELLSPTCSAVLLVLLLKTLLIILVASLLRVNSTELNKLPVILQLVFWIFSYLVKYEWSENAKTLLNMPIQTIILFSKWLPSGVIWLLTTENTSLYFLVNSDLKVNLFSDSEIQWQSPSPFSDPCFRGYSFE